MYTSLFRFDVRQIFCEGLTGSTCLSQYKDTTNNNFSRFRLVTVSLFPYESLCCISYIHPKIWCERAFVDWFGAPDTELFLTCRVLWQLVVVLRITLLVNIGLFIIGVLRGAVIQLAGSTYQVDIARVRMPIGCKSAVNRSTSHDGNSSALVSNIVHYIW